MSKDQGEATWNRWIKAANKEKERQAKKHEKRLKELLKANAEKKTNNIDYQSEEYKKFCEERKRKYEELVEKGEISKNLETIELSNAKSSGTIDGQGYGSRGGRYYERTSRNGNRYRQYY